MYYNTKKWYIITQKWDFLNFDICVIMFLKINNIKIEWMIYNTKISFFKLFILNTSWRASWNCLKIKRKFTRFRLFCFRFFCFFFWGTFCWCFNWISFWGFNRYFLWLVKSFAISFCWFSASFFFCFKPFYNGR